MPKILIVDDDAQLRSTLQRVLKLKSYEVMDADNGVTALKLARAALPDLIISDINMLPRRSSRSCVPTSA